MIAITYIFITLSGCSGGKTINKEYRPTSITELYRAVVDASKTSEKYNCTDATGRVKTSWD